VTDPLPSRSSSPPSTVRFDVTERAGRSASGGARFAPSPRGASRACADLWGLLLLLCWDSASGSLLYLGELCGVRWPPLVPVVVDGGQVLAVVGACVWLLVRVTARVPLRGGGGRAVAVACAAAAVGLTSLCTAVAAAGRLPEGMAFIAVLLWLSLEVCRRHGITPAQLGICPPRARTPRGRARAVYVAGASLGLCAAVGYGMYYVQLAVWRAGLALPVGDQSEALGVTASWQLVPMVIRTLIGEDLILVAVVTALLTAARRPVWQIYVISCGLELAVHAYLGLPGLLMLVWAVCRIRLYRRYGRLIPLALGHAAWDLGDLMPPVPETVLFTAVVAVCLLAELYARAPDQAKGTRPPSLR
jgi:hypothetical protein